jgi:hypothetical protein
VDTLDISLSFSLMRAVAAGLNVDYPCGQLKSDLIRNSIPRTR